MKILIISALLIIIISIIYLINLINAKLSILSLRQEELRNNINKIDERQNNINVESIKNLGNFSLSINKSIADTYRNIATKLATIDEAQKNVNELSKNIMEFQKILTDKKTRGIFGEIQLTQVLKTIFGDERVYYDLQYKMDEGKIVDAVLFAPEPLGMIPIDSKFPLENFKRIENGENVQKEFERDVKKHIKDISEKYIKAQGLNQAIIFIPAESIYNYIIANCDTVVEYSYENKVWLSSPTNLMAILTIMQMVIRDAKRSKKAEELYKDLNNLNVEFERLAIRWEKLSKDLKRSMEDMNTLDTTVMKIGDKFGKIKNGE